MQSIAKLFYCFYFCWVVNQLTFNKILDVKFYIANFYISYNLTINKIDRSIKINNYSLKNLKIKYYGNNL